MRGSLVVTIVGPDRTGLVETLAHEISAAGGNWEASRMVRLAGQFAGVLLVTTPPDGLDALHRALAALTSAGLTVTTHAAGEAPPPATRVAHLDITGADRVGLVRDVARVLAARGSTSRSSSPTCTARRCRASRCSWAGRSCASPPSSRCRPCAPISRRWAAI
jgi:glycine cleavage system regulatory protein